MDRRILLVVAGRSMLACESSPVEVEPVEIPAVDRTAIFDGLRVELTKINYSWMPREGPIPDVSRHSMTVQVTVRSTALDTRTIDPSRFRLRTWDGTELFDPSNTRVWTAIPGGREPSFRMERLGNGERAQGWLTYRVPKGISFLPDVFLWGPVPSVIFVFSVPTSSGSLVCGVSRIFGSVTDEDGLPVGSVPLELAYYNLRHPRNAFDGNSCRGDPTFRRDLETDENGRYENRVGSRFCDKLCVRLTVFPSDADETVEVTGGTVVPTAGHPLVEPSELRIDAVVSGRRSRSR